MDALVTLLLVPVALSALALLAVAFGADSRDGFSDRADPTGPAGVRRWL